LYAVKYGLLRLGIFSSRPVVLQAGCPSCRPTNSVKALKGNNTAFQQHSNFHSILTQMHRAKTSCFYGLKYLLTAEAIETKTYDYDFY